MSVPPHEPRFVALDVHKTYLVVGALDRNATVVLSPRRVPIARFAAWAQQHWYATDQVVLEATGNAFELGDLLQPLVARVVVANPFKVRLIADSTVKTDRRDTLTLARLLVADLIPEVWVPPAHVRELRALIAHRQRLTTQQTAAKNRLHSMVQRRNLQPPASGAIWLVIHRAWWTAQALSPAERVRVLHDCATIDHLERQRTEVDVTLAELSIPVPWAEQVPFLIQLPGIGLLTAMTVLSAIGDISRFPSAKQLVGYSGLGVRVHVSGKIARSGGITREGRRDLRTALVEAAWAATQASPLWKRRYDVLAVRIGSGKAIVALARKLLVIIWHVLTKREADADADAGAVARRFLRWSSNYGPTPRQGQSRGAFIRQRLMQLGIGDDLTRFVYGGQPIILPPVATVDPGG